MSDYEDELEPLIPGGLETAFSAAKDAKLLTVHGIDGANCGWLTVRLLGHWLKLASENMDPETGRSEVGIVVCAFKQNFAYYEGHLRPFGIDLSAHLRAGHLTFMGNQFRPLITDYDAYPPTPPSTTFEAQLELLMERSYEMRPHYKRTVLLLDNPEMGMRLTSDADDVRVEKWLMAVDGATYNYDNALVTMVVDFSHPLRFPVSDLTADASASAVCSLNLNSQLAVTVRPSNGLPTSGTDGRVSIVYRMDYHVDVGPEIDDGQEEDAHVKVARGENIEISGPAF